MKSFLLKGEKMKKLDMDDQDIIEQLEEEFGCKMKILNMDDPDFIEQLEKALGCNLNDCEITTPQFLREDGILPGKPPKDKKFFDSLKNVPEKTLIQLGLRQWKRGHWLYPGEWYDSIPEGYPVVDIFGETELFEHGKTDDDIRCGCLAFGFIKNDGNNEYKVRNTILL